MFPRGLIVSSQALEGNPFRNSEYLAVMAEAAVLGGAVAIRANGVEDITEMRRRISVPIIGIDKKKDSSGRTVITPDFEGAKRVIEAGATIIAMDVTDYPSDIAEDRKTLIDRIHNELGLMVMAVRNMYNGTSGTELMGKKLGIHAYGNVGRNVARIAKGFGMDIYAYDAYCPDEAMIKEGVTPMHSAEELYATCDVVSLHIPATPETKGSINHALLAHMPKGALLVNTARKEVINEEELIQFMQERNDFRYVTDIMPAADQKMYELFQGRYFATPKKMGAQTAEANINAGIAAAKQIVDFIQNGNTRFQVNK
jgi:D-3-phosphoglycerate dehydrogenase